MVTYGLDGESLRGSLRDGEHRWKSVHREVFRLDFRVPCSSVDHILGCEMFHSA